MTEELKPTIFDFCNICSKKFKRGESCECGFSTDYIIWIPEWNMKVLRGEKPPYSCDIKTINFEKEGEDKSETTNPHRPKCITGGSKSKSISTRSSKSNKKTSGNVRKSDKESLHDKWIKTRDSFGGRFVPED